MSDTPRSKSAIRSGAITGGLAVVLYLTWSVVPLPASVNLVAHFAFGPLLVAAFAGIFFYLERFEQRFLHLVATVYGAIGGVFFSAMTVVQHAVIWRVVPAYEEAAVGAAQDAARHALRAADTVQLGLDVVWDVYITLATILVGSALLRRAGALRIYGAVGAGLGAATLLLNLWTFPLPPAGSGLVDLGPFVGAWFGGLCILLFRSR